jgi:hypothetical protein
MPAILPKVTHGQKNVRQPAGIGAVQASSACMRRTKKKLQPIEQLDHGWVDVEGDYSQPPTSSKQSQRPEDHAPLGGALLAMPTTGAPSCSDG